MAFPFEKLEVYKKSLEWVREADNLIKLNRDQISRTQADQLSRSALSVSLNIAEGVGRWHKNEKKRFYWMARGSAYECVPILQVMLANGTLDEILYSQYYKLIDEICKMLSGLIQATDKLDDLPRPTGGRPTGAHGQRNF